MRALRAFVLGAVAAGVVAYAVAAALAVTAQAGERTLELALGPLGLVTVARDGPTTVTTFGAGLVVVACVGGLANLAAALLLARRARCRGDGVD
jgi:hypothetical protein